MQLCVDTHQNDSEGLKHRCDAVKRKCPLVIVVVYLKIASYLLRE
jgi:hypothetical protein